MSGLMARIRSLWRGGSAIIPAANPRNQPQKPAPETERRQMKSRDRRLAVHLHPRAERAVRTIRSSAARRAFDASMPRAMYSRARSST
jgi:hypothetical protein